MSFIFFFNSILLGVGLAMDAFSVSIANALAEPKMLFRRMSFIAGIYAFFQFFMPMLGWICVHTILDLFSAFQIFIPYIAFLLLLYIGGSMIVESYKGNDLTEIQPVNLKTLLIQGIATSIDALSVGFTIADYHIHEAFISAFIIAIVTFIICIIGLFIGKAVGSKFSKKALIYGGCILIFIGFEILISNLFS